ncbi:MAG: hypothetical protein GQ527_04120 [Bacteroidales bacterium]|nr:hypothetical protein [Bacteroidales bacterium]
MKKRILFIVLWSMSFNLIAQESITLQQCFESAIVNHPIYIQKELKAMNSDLETENLKKDLLPQFMVNGKATYQSEVISLPFDIPGMDVPELSKDQYRLSLDVNQVIYRGGLYQKQRELEAHQQILEQLDVDKNLYYLKNDVKAIFFAIILLDEQKNIVESYQQRLNVKLEEIKSLVDEGVALESATDRIKVEQLEVEQRLSEISIQRQSFMDNLQLLTKMDLSEVKELLVTPVNLEVQEQQRLEYTYMTAAQSTLEYSKQLINVQKLPKLSAFASGGYGRPGFNYLSDEFDDFLMVGVNLQWKILNWNKFNNQKKMLDIQIQTIASQKEDFQLNINLALGKMMSEIVKWEDLLQKDPEMIQLRGNVVKNASHQLKQGMITTSAYIDELQKLSQAEINMKIHEIQLISSKLDYLNILGKL